MRKSTPQQIDTNMNSAWAIWMMRRQSKRCASAPAYTENSRNGSQWLTIWNPTSHGEWKVCHSTQ